MPAALASLEKLEGLAQELNIKVHFLLWGAPEHVSFALIEADNSSKLARYVMAIDMKQDFKVVPVQHMSEVVSMAKAMMGQSQGDPSEGSPPQGSPYGGSPPPGQSSFPQS